jgi:hypothetical protein
MRFAHSLPQKSMSRKCYTGNQCNCKKDFSEAADTIVASVQW